MTFVPNPNFGDQISTQVRRLQEAIEDVSKRLSGHDLGEVRTALQDRVAQVGHGASITDPELTAGARVISSGKRLWLDDDGKLKGED